VKNVRSSALKVGEPPRVTLVLFVAKVNALTAQALAYGRSLNADQFEAVNVAMDTASQQRLRGEWAALNVDIPLVVVRSINYEFLRPATQYIRSLRPGPDHSVLVLIPELVVEHWYQAILHNRSGTRLTDALSEIPWVVVASVPLQLSLNTQESE